MLDSAQDMAKLAIPFSIIVLNCYTLVAFCCIKKKKFSTYLFISLSLSDLMIGLTSSLPFTIVTSLQLKNAWSFSNTMCYLYLGFKHLNIMITNDTILMLAYHRYNQMRKPFGRFEKVACGRLLLYLSPWFYRPVYVTLCILMLLSFNGIRLYDCSYTFSPLHSILSIVLIEVPILSLGIVLNIMTICKLIKRRRAIILKMRNNSRSRINESLETSSFVINNNNQTNLFSRIKRSFRRDLKAILCISLMILNIIATILTTIIAYELVYVFGHNTSSADSAFVIATLNPLFNAIIILIFNSNIKILNLID